MKEDPSDSAIRSLIPNRRKLLRLKAGSGVVCRRKHFPFKEARVVTDAERLGEAAQLTCRGGPLTALFMTFQALDVGPSPTP
jgi:hypothetical protein